MFRARLASLTLAAGLLAATGCNTCGPGLHLFQRHQTHTDCGCGSQPVVVGSAPSVDGPMLFPQDAGTLPSNTTPPPRIVPVPQATPTPYAPGQPTGLRRLFDRNP